MVADAGAGLAELATLPAPILVFEDGRVVVVNTAAAAEIGRPANELIERRFQLGLQPDSARELETALVKVGEPGASSLRLTVRQPCDRGGNRYFEIRLQPGEVGRVTAFVSEVTETHRLDAAVAALASSTVAIDTSANLVWRPFGNAGRFGVADEDAIGVKVMEWLHPEELPHILELFARIIEEPGLKLTEIIRMRHPYVTDGWLVTRISAVNCLENPALGAIVVRAEDAAPVDLVDDLTHTTGRFSSLAEATPVGIVVTDLAGAVLYCNELARQLLGYERDLIGRTDWLTGLRSEAADALERVLTEAREDQHHGTLVVSLERAGAGPRWLRVDAVPQVDEQGRSCGLIASLLDVTNETETRQQLAEAQDRLWHLATHDPLTNLANRVLFIDRVEDALELRTGDSPGVALLYCDLDGFKPVNDRFGHSVGDKVLRIVAERLSDVVRASDVVGRFGGDEFLVLCQGFGSEAEVGALADRLVEVVKQPIEVEGQVIRVGMTVGVAYASDASEVDELISSADRAMYSRKPDQQNRP